MERLDQNRDKSNIWIGLLLLLIGAGLLLRQMNLPIASWIFSWEMLVIVIGFFVGLRGRFRNIAWAVIMVIGGVFLLDNLFPSLSWHSYGWPLALIIIGFFILFKPRKKPSEWDQLKYSEKEVTKTISSDDVLDYTTAFGAIERNILSKNFRGGEVLTIFGGTELNFLQADINGKVVLDLTQIFGGTKLMVPSHWDVKSEMVAIFGGIDDKRVQNAEADHNKLLILRGTSIFGGIEVVSY